METTLSVVYGRTLDIAALGSFTIKPFAIFIIAFYTPKYLRSTSYFILNEMLWNLAGNLLFVLGRPFPMLPTQCIRLDGLIGPYLENEWMRHAFFLLIVASSVNCNIGLLTMFRFRYMVIANKEFISRTRPLWGYAICIMLHIAGTAIFVALNVNAATTIEEYSNTESIPSAANLFCFKRSGWQKNLLLWSFFASMIGFKVLLVAYTLLCFYELRKQKSSLEKFTLVIQRTVLRNLVFMTAVPVFLACFPLLIAALFILFNEWPYAQLVAAISYMLAANHGTVYSVLTLAVFKSYRKAVKTMWINAIRGLFKKNSILCRRTKITKVASSPRVGSLWTGK